VRGLLKLAIVAALAWFGWNKYQDHRAADLARQSPKHQVVEDLTHVERTTSRDNFVCDGRTRCGEMKSCDEARYFVKHCPGIEMDGDDDGKPCEDWCGH
jgi:predicted negative regulator of RcsB-dependent stress response